MKKILMIAAMTALGAAAQASLVTEYNQFVTAGKTADAVGLGTSIAADAGDVIVFSASSSGAYVKSYSVVSGDGGAVGAETGVWLDKNVTVSYFTVATGGTFDFGVVGNATTFDSFGAYVIGSDQVGYSVAEIGSDTSYVGPNVSVMNTLDYGTLASGGLVVEGAQSAFFTSYPTGMNVSTNSGNSRTSAYGAFSAGALTSTYSSNDITKNQRAAGIAFTEVIPEPATMGMLGFGALITLLVRRFRM